MEWSDLGYLLAVARARSLSGAAQRLGVSTSTVARRLAALEAVLGLRLIDRRPDGAVLTPHGYRLAEQAGSVEERVAELERAAAALRQGAWPDPVAVTATEFVVSEILAPAVADLFARAPGLRLDLRSQSGVVSLAQREADVAIRMARPVGDSLFVRKLPAVHLGLYASRAYLNGRPPRSLDLTAERLLVYDETYGAIPELRWLEEASLAGAAFLRTPSTRALLNACTAGAGVGFLPKAFADAEPALVEVPPPHPIPPRTPWLVVHRDLRRVRAVRVVGDWIVATFDALLRKG